VRGEGVPQTVDRGVLLDARSREDMVHHEEKYNARETNCQAVCLTIVW
jgi:hypothetical protein